MARKKSHTCGATVETADGRTLECALPAGHGGDLHETADGEHWGDLALMGPPAEA